MVVVCIIATLSSFPSVNLAGPCLRKSRVFYAKLSVSWLRSLRRQAFRRFGNRLPLKIIAFSGPSTVSSTNGPDARRRTLNLDDGADVDERVGSSKMMSLGFCTSDLAITTFCWLPPESSILPGFSRRCLAPARHVNQLDLVQHPRAIAYRHGRRAAHHGGPAVISARTISSASRTTITGRDIERLWPNERCSRLMNHAPSLFTSEDHPQPWSVPRAALHGAAIGFLAALIKAFRPFHSVDRALPLALDIGVAVVAFALLCAAARCCAICSCGVFKTWRGTTTDPNRSRGGAVVPTGVPRPKRALAGTIL